MTQDMTAALAPKSDQINSEDLVGRTMTVTITGVDIRPGQEQPIAMSLAGTDKVFRPCKTTARLIVAGWGPDASKYAGRQITLYRDPSVKWGGVAIGGIRISHMSDLDAPLVMALAENKKNRKVHTVQPLKIEKQQASADSLTLDAARDLIEQAPDMDSLGAVWKRKTMAPFREELQAALDKRKAELAPPAEEQFAGDEA